jgi:type II secretory pathway pseudopilin PulG
MAVVIALIGVLMSFGLSALNVYRNGQNASATLQKQIVVRDALIVYLRQYKRLPCPDTDFTAPDGIENRATPGDTNTACTAAAGLVPYVTLNLPRDSAIDGYENYFSYIVSRNSGSNPLNEWTKSAGFAADRLGELTIRTRAFASPFALTDLTTTAAVVLVSHGRNGLGAYSRAGTRNTIPSSVDARLIDEQTNASLGITYVRRDSTTDDTVTGGAFDDVVMFLSPGDLMSYLLREGTLKPAQAIIDDAWVRIRATVAAYAMATANTSNYDNSNCNLVTGTGVKCKLLPSSLTSLLSDEDLKDPWGTPYDYAPTALYANTARGFSSADSGPGIAFTITSRGPDKTLATGDDITRTMSMAELVGMVGASRLP